MEVDAVAMLDLDQFKQINDVYGHQAGDDALRMLVSAVTACVRNRSDALVRYGGDEFLLIFPHIPERRNKCVTAAFSAEEAEKPKPNQESDKL